MIDEKALGAAFEQALHSLGGARPPIETLRRILEAYERARDVPELPTRDEIWQALYECRADTTGPTDKQATYVLGLLRDHARPLSAKMLREEKLEHAETCGKLAALREACAWKGFALSVEDTAEKLRGEGYCAVPDYIERIAAAIASIDAPAPKTECPRCHGSGAWRDSAPLWQHHWCDCDVGRRERAAWLERKERVHALRILVDGIRIDTSVPGAEPFAALEYVDFPGSACFGEPLPRRVNELERIQGLLVSFVSNCRSKSAGSVEEAADQFWYELEERP